MILNFKINNLLDIILFQLMNY